MRTMLSKSHISQGGSPDNGIRDAANGSSIGIHVSQCPGSLGAYRDANEELKLIRSAHSTLTQIGCDSSFCQSGRANKLSEFRIGRDRPSSEVKDEAEKFLRECRDMNVIDSDKLLYQRIGEALSQIEGDLARIETVRSDTCSVEDNIGGTWEQGYHELEYGIRAAWKNAKRCIMRSEHSRLA